MVRRWRGLRIRRGAQFSAPPVSPVPPPCPPRIIRPAGSLRFGARLLPSRRRRSDPGWGQGPLGTAFPAVTRQAGTRARATLKAPRGRQLEPPWGIIAPPPPQYLRPGGALRAALRLPGPRRRPAEPPWPQGNQGQAWPSFTRQPGSGASRGIRLLLSRGRRFDPPWPQGPLTSPFPAMTARRMTRAPMRRTSAGRRFDPPWFPPLTPQPPQMLRPAGSLRFAARLLPGQRRRADPPWPQGPLGVAYPSVTARRPARAPMRRTAAGRRFDPPWAVPVAIAPAYLHHGGARPHWAHTRLISRQRRWDPPWPQATPPPPPAGFGTGFLAYFP